MEWINFSRFHTIKATILISVTSVVKYSLEHKEIPLNKIIKKSIIGTTILLAANFSVVGFNQIIDVKIDKLNNKMLPCINQLQKFKQNMLCQAPYYIAYY